jgi:hypothetical protein
MHGNQVATKLRVHQAPDFLLALVGFRSLVAGHNLDKSETVRAFHIIEEHMR